MLPEKIWAAYSGRVVRPSASMSVCQSVDSVSPKFGPLLCYLKLDFKLFHRNDHHIETMCRAQHLGCYLEGQGHSMTL